MKFVTSLSVERMHGASIPFWPHGVKRLVVVVSHPDPGEDTLVAYGVDPDHGRGHGRVVFEAQLPRARLSAFLKAVIDGDKAAVDHHKTVTMVETRSDAGEPGYPDAGEVAYPCAGDVVVISYRDPADLGPKVALGLAAAIRSDEALAEAVARRYPPRMLAKDC